MTPRWVISHMHLLPEDSRIKKHTRNDPFDMKEHLLTDLFDAINNVAFTTSISASADAGKRAKQAFSQAPKPVKRPKLRDEPEEKPKKKKFLSGRELKRMFGS